MITPASHSDVTALVELINSAYRGESSKKGWTTEADLLDGTRTDPANVSSLLDDEHGTVLKYLDDNGIITGCMNLQKCGSKLYLGMLTVAPELQGAGIGKQLLAAAEDYAGQNKCTSIYMTVISVRSELIAWYERHGYKKTGEEKPFPVGEPFGIQKQPLKLIVLEKEI